MDKNMISLVWNIKQKVTNEQNKIKLIDTTEWWLPEGKDEEEVKWVKRSNIR